MESVSWLIKHRGSLLTDPADIEGSIHEHLGHPTQDRKPDKKKERKKRGRR